MPDDVLELADRLWRGEVPSSEYHPVGHLGGLAEICEGAAFVPSFARKTVIMTSSLSMSFSFVRPLLWKKRVGCD